MKDQCLTQIKQLTKHDHVALTSRGNTSILIALLTTTKSTVLIPKEGGWLSYEKIATALNKKVIKINTNKAILDLDHLKSNLNQDAVLLYHSVAGYFAPQDIKQIYNEAEKAGSEVIMDVSGSIGTEYCNGNYADIIIGSFSKWKLVDANMGAFISFTNKELYDKAKPLIKSISLPVDTGTIYKRLTNLKSRIDTLNGIRQQTMADLENQNLEIIGKEHNLGFIVLVKYKNEIDKLNIQTYCTKHNLEYTICPREIRVMEDAISIEIKRIASE